MPNGLEPCKRFGSEIDRLEEFWKEFCFIKEFDSKNSIHSRSIHHLFRFFHCISLCVSTIYLFSRMIGIDGGSLTLGSLTVHRVCQAKWLNQFDFLSKRCRSIKHRRLSLYPAGLPSGTRMPVHLVSSFYFCSANPKLGFLTSRYRRAFESRSSRLCSHSSDCYQVVLTRLGQQTEHLPIIKLSLFTLHRNWNPCAGLSTVSLQPLDSNG